MSNHNAYEELYLEQKKKNSIMLVAIIALVIISVGSIVWGVSQANNSSGAPQGATGQNGQGFPGGGGPDGGMGQMNFAQFFNDDDSVDTEAVEEFVSRMPSGGDSQFLERFKENINQAAEDGDITSTQASELIAAFESAAGGSTSEN